MIYQLWINDVSVTLTSYFSYKYTQNIDTNYFLFFLFLSSFKFQFVVGCKHRQPLGGAQCLVFSFYTSSINKSEFTILFGVGCVCAIPASCLPFLLPLDGCHGDDEWLPPVFPAAGGM